MTIETVKDLTSFKWATVVSFNPFRIKLDGDTAPLALTPDSLVDPLLLAVNDRVRVELSLRKAVIHGRSYGERLPGRLAAANNLGPGNNPNDITATGWYSGYSWTGPLTGFSIGTLMVIQYSPDWINQQFQSTEEVPQLLVRSRHSGTTWGKFQKVTTVTQAF